MALRFLEGFEEYTTTTGNALGTEVVLMRSHSGYRWNYWYRGSDMELNGSLYRSPQSSPTAKSLYLRNSHLDLALPSVSEIFIGIAVHLNSPGTFLTLSSTNSTSASLPTTGIRLRRHESSGFEVVAGNTGVNLAPTTSPCMPLNTWSYVELYYKFGASGDIQVRIEGVEVLNLTGIDTRGGAASIQNLALCSTSSAILYYFDDLYLCDATGTVNNTFLGPIAVQTRMPTADSAVAFTRNTGTSNFSCVNEIPHNGATSYVSSATAGSRDLYETADLSGTGLGPIAGIQCNVRGQALGSSANLALTIESPKGAQIGATKTQTSAAWIADFDIFEKQADGSDWTAADVNNTKIGFDSV
ncbi:hypothetical protein [Bdellovibrio sp. HCB337]|uniref:hypothetical protein n=1 Tax=Bdellovibrio sp. HCB337 TaxID=3394358 RepID=UPI0039A43CDE